MSLQALLSAVSPSPPGPSSSNRSTTTRLLPLPPLLLPLLPVHDIVLAFTSLHIDCSSASCSNQKAPNTHLSHQYSPTVLTLSSTTSLFLSETCNNTDKDPKVIICIRPFLRSYGWGLSRSRGIPEPVVIVRSDIVPSLRDEDLGTLRPGSRAVGVPTHYVDGFIVLPHDPFRQETCQGSIVKALTSSVASLAHACYPGNLGLGSGVQSFRGDTPEWPGITRYSPLGRLLRCHAEDRTGCIL